MTEQIVYHRVIPENLKDSYVEFDQVDFNLSFEGRKMVVGSLRLEGELEVRYDGRTLDDTTVVDGSQINEKYISFDGAVGAHAFCESYTTSISGGRIIENLTEYPRYVKMATTATEGRSDMNNSKNICQLKAPLDEMTVMYMKGEDMASPYTPAVRCNPDFSIKPLICLNSGSGNISHKKTGDVRVSLQMNRNFGALGGVDNTSKTTYAIRNLRLRYLSVPEDNKDESVVLKTKLNIKQSIQSSFANIQTKVPALCTAVSVSFLEQANENSAKYNNQELNQIPNLSQTQFMFNDSTNTLITYLIKNNSEVTQRYIDSFLDTGRNTLTTADLVNNNGRGVGLDFGQVIDLSQQRFSLQLTSEVSSSNPLIAFMYFHSFIEV
tara:strand:+ start:926 stop:2065 length:1140 start_codon:yes stop_codon:yes gene_type:complete